MARDQTYRAVVQRIIRDGPHGPFAICTLSGNVAVGSVTFSLDSHVWPEQIWPEPGTLVVVSDVVKKRAGWRAHSARFVRLSDEQATHSKEH
jgi:hypothetical protein